MREHVALLSNRHNEIHTADHKRECEKINVYCWNNVKCYEFNKN